ncbi:MAG: DUF3173 family protein, partial [Anaerobutyricum hallii]
MEEWTSADIIRKAKKLMIEKGHT